MRAAAVASVQKKIQQMRARDEDDSSDDDDEEEIEEEDSSSDSDVGKRRRGRASPRSRPPPVIKSRDNVRSNVRSARGKNLAPPKRDPIPMLSEYSSYFAIFFFYSPVHLFILI